MNFPERLDESGVIEAVNAALAGADAMGASDVHLEPRPDGYQIRVRKDGVFLDQGRRDLAVAQRVIARLKVMARLAVHRVDTPQEGGLELPDQRGHGRLSVVPTVNGEKVVLRLLDRRARVEGLAGLGFEARVAAGLGELIRAEQGLVLITGPSGAGKTTTLYALLEEIRARQGAWRSLATLEDPVERNLGTIAQTEVAPERGVTFPSGLRALLRQDPEVIMVGEIRDPETARIAVQASLTGHLVLSSLHTSSVFEALTRLRDLGVDTGLAAGALRGILSQRLVPRASGEGRAVVAELLTLCEALREQVRARADESRLEATARAQGCLIGGAA